MTNEQILRHPNGGALKFGTEVHVSADSYCDSTTEIGGSSSIFQSNLKGSIVTNSRIFESAVETTWLYSSDCSKSSLQGVFTQECILDRVVATNGGHAGILTLKDVVAENCELHGTWKLDGIARIPAGIWYRPPRFKHITGENGVSVGLTESTEGYALMACWRKHVSKWLEFGPRLGRRHRWTEQQIREAADFFMELLDNPMEGVRA